MVNCQKCDKYFPKNCQLQRHLNRKYPCVTNNILIVKNINKINEIENQIKELTKQSIESKKNCKFCTKKLANKNNVERHIEFVCPTKKDMIEEKNKLIEENKILEEKEKTDKLSKYQNQNEELQNQIKILQNTVQKLMNKNIKETPPNTIINNTTINNPTINNNLTININSFGKESLDHITEADYKKYLNGFFKGFLNLIEKIHFDENAPENHNVCLTNMRSKYAYVCENNNWVLKDKEDIINKLINKKYDLLNDKFEEFEENNKLSNKILDNFKEFQENYNDAEAQKNTKENVKLMLYNNREKIEKKIKK